MNMKWSIDGVFLTEVEVLERLKKLKQYGPTGVVLIGADGALKTTVIQRLYQGLPGEVTTVHQYGGAAKDLADGMFVLDNPFGNDVIADEVRRRCIRNFREAGALNVVGIWAKNEKFGYGDDLARGVDKVLRDNPPNKKAYSLFLEVDG